MNDTEIRLVEKLKIKPQQPIIQKEPLYKNETIVKRDPTDKVELEDVLKALVFQNSVIIQMLGKIALKMGIIDATEDNKK